MTIGFVFIYYRINEQFVCEAFSERKVIGFTRGTGIVIVSNTTNAKDNESKREQNLVSSVTVGLNAAIGDIIQQQNSREELSTRKTISIAIFVDINAAGIKHFRCLCPFQWFTSIFKYIHNYRLDFFLQIPKQWLFPGEFLDFKVNKFDFWTEMVFVGINQKRQYFWVISSKFK